MGLRTKIILAIVVVMTVGLGTAGAIMLRQRERLLLVGAQERARTMLAAMAPPLAIELADGDFEAVDNYIGRISTGRRARELQVEYAMVLDAQGRIYSHTDPTTFGETPAGEFYAAARNAAVPVFHRCDRSGGAPVLEAAMPITSGVRWGTLVVAFSLADELRVLGEHRLRIVVGAVLLALACIVALYLLLTYVVLAPVRRLAQAAETLAKGERQPQLPVLGRDELAQLGKRFNRMAEELASHTQQLEARVRERASELVDKNRELSEVNARLAEAVTLLEQLAVTDVLTGLYNRRKFEEALLLEVRRNLRRKHPFCLLMIDVDHFKHYNDTHGHPAGDAVLRELGALFHQTFRSLDVAARYGGEEFCVLLLDTELAGAQVAAEKIRAATEATDFAGGPQQPGGRLTISVGVAAYPAHGVSPKELVEAADRALYAAKHAGRNRVVVAGGEGGDAH
jgi:diguanylate cyclase (GGDEF)-like protein